MLNTKYKMKILFIKGEGNPFSEVEVGYGGTALATIAIAKYLAKKHTVGIFHPDRKTNFIGNSGIHYLKEVNESDYDVLIDIRESGRKIFHKDKLHVHWIHDPHKYNENVNGSFLEKYDKVITLCDTQLEEWKKTNNTKNFCVVPNLFIDEGVQKTNFNPFKIISFSSKTKFDFAFKVVKKLRKFDSRFHLHVCSPRYFDISKKIRSVDYVTNHNTLPHYEMLDLLKDAFVFLYPTEFQESFGYVCYESMFFGVPILTDYVSGSSVNEIVPQSLIFKPRSFGLSKSSSAWAKKIWDWSQNNNRPTVYWQHDNESIYNQWDSLLKNFYCKVKSNRNPLCLGSKNKIPTIA